jgi:serine/threonine protein kinase
MMDRTDTLVSTRLGPYLLEEVLGRGGAATVYRAHQASLGRDVAIKVLRRDADPQFAARFARESRAIAGLQHPNILPVYDFGEDGALQYLVMRYVPGGRTLRDELLAGPLEPVPALRVMERLLDALGFAHARGIVHRDIKPGNVLLPAPDWPLLADFGIARLGAETSQLTLAGQAIGTPDYMSPEQASGRPVDPRSDLYSAGVVLFEMLTGSVPFRGESALAVAVQHIGQPPPAPRLLNPALPESVEPLLTRALAKSPDERYQTAAELASALARLAEQLERRETQRRDIGPPPVLAPGGPTPAPPRAAPASPRSASRPLPDLASSSPAGRRRAPLLIGLALIAAVAVALALLRGQGGVPGAPATGFTPIRVEDDAWQGGYRYDDGRTYGGRSATWIYGSSTQFSSMSAAFELPEAPECRARLTVEGMDSEGGAKTPIRVEVNGAEIYSGPNPLPDDDIPLDTGTWASHAFEFDGDLLRAGRNEVRISNLAEGAFSLPPFFMLDYAEIGCAG